jgi:hypothetical protein
MNPEQQRIAIAEACGWRIESDGANTFVYSPNKTSGTGYRMNDIRHPKIIKLLPDYLNDLNAMHEAEESLHGRLDLWWNYMDTLEKVSVEFNPLGCGSQIHATATQRAEAFLKTIGKWRGAWK